MHSSAAPPVFDHGPGEDSADEEEYYGGVTPTDDVEGEGEGDDADYDDDGLIPPFGQDCPPE